MVSFRRFIKVFWHCLVIMIGIGVGYYLHHDYKVSSEARIADAKQSLSGIESDLKNSQMILDRYNAARDGFRPYISLLFPPMKPEALIGEIKSQASSHGVRLTDIKLDVPKFIEIRGRKDAISIVPFEISFAGGFFSLGQFLEALEKAPYLQNISEMGMSAGSGSGTEIKLSLKGGFRFFQKDVIEKLVNDGI